MSLESFKATFFSLYKIIILNSQLSKIYYAVETIRYVSVLETAVSALNRRVS